MEVCGEVITESRVALFVVATTGLVLLVTFTALAVWIDTRYQRRFHQPETRWRTKEERDDDTG